VTLFQVEIAASVLQSETTPLRDRISSESSIVRLDVRAGVSVLIGCSEEYGIGRSEGSTFVDDGSRLFRVEEFGALAKVVL
jgi:hypothetical protein